MKDRDMNSGKEPLFMLQGDEKKLIDALVEHGFDVIAASKATGMSVQAFESVSNMLSNLDVSGKPSAEGWDLLEQKTLARLEEHDRDKFERLRFKSDYDQVQVNQKKWFPDFISVAAVILLVVGVVGLYYQNPKNAFGPYDTVGDGPMAWFDRAYLLGSIIETEDGYVWEDVWELRNQNSKQDLDMQVFDSKEAMIKLRQSPSKEALFGSPNLYIRELTRNPSAEVNRGPSGGDEDRKLFKTKYMGSPQSVRMADFSVKINSPRFTKLTHPCYVISQTVGFFPSREALNGQFQDDFWWKDDAGGIFDIHLRPARDRGN